MTTQYKHGSTEKTSTIGGDGLKNIVTDVL